MTHLLNSLGSAVTILFAQPVAPSPVADPVRLEYLAADSCSDRGSFVEQIRSRTDRLREARPGESALAVEVTITEAQSGVRGRLRTRAPNGSQSERTINGASCTNVVSALALIVALAIDPEASTTPRPAPERRAEPPPPPPPRPPAAEREAQASSRGPSWGFGVQSSLLTAVAPDPLFALGAYLKLELVNGPLSGAEAKLSVQHGTQTARVAGGAGDIAWTSAHVDGCPVSVRPSRAVYFAPCLGFDGGVVTVSGADTPNTETVTRPWLSIGALLRMGLRPVRWLAVEPEVGIGFPLIRDRYFLRPDTTVHDVPAVELQAGLAVGAVLE